MINAHHKLLASVNKGGGWPPNISTFVYSGDTFDTASRNSNTDTIYVSPDGLHMYNVNYSTKVVYQWSLVTPFILSSASYVRSFTASGAGGFPLNVFFSYDGVYMFVVSNSAKALYRYTLGTAWNISTAGSLTSMSLSPALNPRQGCISPDGNHLYVVCLDNERVYHWNLSAPYSVSSPSYNGSISVGSDPRGVAVSFEGSYLYVVDQQADEIQQYSFGTPWDITTAVNDNVPWDTTGITGSPAGICWVEEGASLYLSPFGGDVYRLEQG